MRVWQSSARRYLLWSFGSISFLCSLFNHYTLLYLKILLTIVRTKRWRDEVHNSLLHDGRWTKIYRICQMCVVRKRYLIRNCFENFAQIRDGIYIIILRYFSESFFDLQMGDWINIDERSPNSPIKFNRMVNFSLCDEMTCEVRLNPLLNLNIVWFHFSILENTIKFRVFDSSRFVSHCPN